MKQAKSVINETQGGLDRGVFGAPTVVIEEEIYWGKDRMAFIARHLETGQAERAVSDLNSGASHALAVARKTVAHFGF